MDNLVYSQDAYFIVSPTVFISNWDEQDIFSKDKSDYLNADYCQVTINKGVIAITPKSETCRANLCNNTSFGFKKLNEYGDKLNLSFSLSAKGNPKDFFHDKVSNIYSGDLTPIEPVFPDGYDRIFGNGSIRISPGTRMSAHACKSVNITVPVLDILVANTCVLLDRDNDNVERRKYVGKAGEYSTQGGDLTYHVLSNFWIQNQHMTSFVTGMIRFAMHIVGLSTPERDYASKLTSLVNRDSIIEAINTNNFDLAKENFDKIIPFICSIINKCDHHRFPITGESLDDFYYLIKVGYKSFVNNSRAHWSSNHIEGHSQGAENFLLGHVRKNRLDKREDLKQISINEIWVNFLKL